MKKKSRRRIGRRCSEKRAGEEAKRKKKGRSRVEVIRKERYNGWKACPGTCLESVMEFIVNFTKSSHLGEGTLDRPVGGYLDCVKTGRPVH